MDAVAFAANIATLVGVPLALIALFVGAFQLRAGRLGASAGSYITLNESLRQAWLQFATASGEDQKQHAFSDTINLLESACAIYRDKVFVGTVGILLRDYICHVLVLIRDSDDAKKRMEGMFMTPKTFEHIRWFNAKHRKLIANIKFPSPGEPDAA